jgi:hypothetical protein
MSLIEEPVDDIGGTVPESPHDAADDAVVHWMEPKRLAVGPAGLSATAVGAFALGAATAVAVLALAHWIGPERTVVIERPSRRGG